MQLLGQLNNQSMDPNMALKIRQNQQRGQQQQLPPGNNPRSSAQPSKGPVPGQQNPISSSKQQQLRIQSQRQATQCKYCLIINFVIQLLLQKQSNKNQLVICMLPAKCRCKVEFHREVQYLDLDQQVNKINLINIIIENIS